MGPARETVDVVVPVAGAPEAFSRCLDSLVAHTDLERNRLVVVLDGPQPPQTLEQEWPAGAVILKNPERRGFVAAVNRGMSASDRDVILLNSDTQVTAGWVEKLQAAAYSAPEIATVTPFSNSATICSLPRFLENNALPAGWDADRFGRLVEERSTRAYPRLPTGVGVCLYIKRKVLAGVGLFDEKSFGEGYGEESDFCMRALKAGYAHVLDDATFIFHEGQRSFGSRRAARVKAAHRVMRWRHPEYLATVARFIREDPLRPLRERVISELQPVRRSRSPGRAERVLHLVHGWPPWSSAGTELYAAWLARRQARHREVLAYSRIGDPQRARGDALELLDHGLRVRLMVNNFTQRNPFSRNALRDRFLESDFAALLDRFQPRLLHVHHLAGHVLSLPAIAARRGIPVVFQLQDWWQPCARANLCDRWQRLCSGPAPGKCSACLPMTGLPPAPLLNRLLYRYRDALVRKALRQADAFVTGSRFLHQSYLDLGYLRPEDPVTVVPYGIETAPPVLRRRREPPLRFGYVGSLGRHKGVHVAVAAFAGIDPAKAKLAIWGDPAGNPTYAQELRESGGAAVELRGAFPEERKPDVFAEIDVLIVPSIGLESFGLVAREALHFGVPVLASDRGALPEMFEGAEDCGALFDPEDPASLRAWIERLIADPAILDRWAASLPPVKGMEAHAEEIEQVYERVLSRR
ncbi:MAG TPA: glycosyltransferase [Thermoanaerobaculia bacterium]|nr:glycosyltransferase [Thermoanaerobaculia bacterium]